MSALQAAVPRWLSASKDLFVSKFSEDVSQDGELSEISRIHGRTVSTSVFEELEAYPSRNAVSEGKEKLLMNKLQVSTAQPLAVFSTATDFALPQIAG